MLASSLQGCVVAGRYFVSVKNGYFFILSHDTTPDLEDHAGELFDSQISQYPLVRHGDHWDYLVNSKLYHISEKCCDKECIPLTKGGFIFDHGNASVLRNRRTREDVQTADLCEILTSESHEDCAGEHGRPEGAVISTKLYIEGMCCSSEATIIHDLLDNFPGVLQVDVSVVTRSAVIKHTAAVLPQTLTACLNHAHLDASCEAPRQQGKLRYQYLPSWNVLLAAFLLVVSLFHYLASRIGNQKLEYMKWIAMGSIVIAIPRILLKALASLRRKRLDINFLMTVAVGGALALQDVTEAAAVVVLFSLADWLESSCTSSARNAIAAVLALKPEVAVLANSGTLVPADTVAVSTLLLVRPGERIAIDGTVVTGSSDVDQSLLTGESKPVKRYANDQLLGGTLNCGSGALTYETTATAGESAVARMAELVEQAVSKQSRVESIITRFATWFTPIIIAACLGIALIPTAAGARDKSHWVYLSLQILVTACPCALVLSTPVTVVAGLAASARQGVLIKGGSHLEALAKIKTVTLDKTGTLTKGRFQVIAKKAISTSEADLLAWAGSLERLSTHPIASCIVACAAVAGSPINLDVTAFENLPGLGVMGYIQGMQVLLGSKALLLQKGVIMESDVIDSVEASWGEEGATICFVARDGLLVGALALADAVRPEAAEAIQRLQKLGIGTKMVTGDAPGPAYAVAVAIGMEPDDVHAALLPEGKLNLIEELQTQGKVLHTGDGVNDAPALAAASVGISMGTSGAAIAVEAGDITLFTNDLRCLAPIIRLGCTVRSIIMFNIAVCIVTKVAVLVLAALGLFTLWGAVLVDVGTACAVCLNGMRCLRWSIDTGSIWGWRLAQSDTACLKQAGTRSSGTGTEDPPACCSQQGGRQGCCDPPEVTKRSCCPSHDIPSCASRETPCKTECAAELVTPLPKKSCCSAKNSVLSCASSTAPASSKSTSELVSPLPKKSCCSSKMSVPSCTSPAVPESYECTKDGVSQLTEKSCCSSAKKCCSAK